MCRPRREGRSFLGAVPMSQLADRGRLAGAVDTDHQDYCGLVGRGAGGAPDAIARDEKRRQLFANRGLGRGRILAAARALDDLQCQRAAHVSGDEQLLDRIPVGRGGSAPKQPRSRDMKPPRLRCRPRPGRPGYRRPGPVRERQAPRLVRTPPARTRQDRATVRARWFRARERPALLAAASTYERGTGRTSRSADGRGGILPGHLIRHLAASSRRRLTTRLTASSLTVTP